MDQQTSSPNQQQRIQQQQNRTNTQRITQLVRAGLIKTSEFPALKIAMTRHAKVGDMAKLSRNQRDLLNRYYQSTAAAALGSQQSTMAVIRNIRNGYEISRDDYISESTIKDPPMMLILKRRGIRIFPDGKRVALYNNDKLGLSFTIPYAGNDSEQELIGVQSEEVSDDIMENIDQVARYAQEETPKATAKHMKFTDGSKLKVSHGVAKAIHIIHSALNDENKKRFADMLSSPKEFKKAANFALNKVNFSINK
jgi:hypothetical protein